MQYVARQISSEAQSVCAAHAQSVGQVLAFSEPSHRPLPHKGGHTPQSDEQVEQLSPPSQAPFPHTGPGMPQSAEHEELVSPDSQAPLPQTGPGVPAQSAQAAVSPISQHAVTADGAGGAQRRQGTTTPGPWS